MVCRRDTFRFFHSSVLLPLPSESLSISSAKHLQQIPPPQDPVTTDSPFPAGRIDVAAATAHNNNNCMYIRAATGRQRNVSCVVAGHERKGETRSAGALFRCLFRSAPLRIRLRCPVRSSFPSVSCLSTVTSRLARTFHARPRTSSGVGTWKERKLLLLLHPSLIYPTPSLILPLLAAIPL